MTRPSGWDTDWYLPQTSAKITGLSTLFSPALGHGIRVSTEGYSQSNSFLDCELDKFPRGLYGPPTYANMAS